MQLKMEGTIRQEMNFISTFFWHERVQNVDLIYIRLLFFLKKFVFFLIYVNNKMANYLLHVCLWNPPKRIYLLALPKWPRNEKDEIENENENPSNLYFCVSKKPNVRPFLGHIFSTYYGEKCSRRQKTEPEYLYRNKWTVYEWYQYHTHWINVSNCMTK